MKSLYILLLLSTSPLLAQTYSIIDFGVKTDTAFLNTTAIQQAIDACYGKGGGEVMVPAGTFITGTVFLKSNVYLHLMPGGVLQGSYNPADYPEHDMLWAEKFGTITHNGLYVENMKALVIADRANHTGIVILGVDGGLVENINISDIVMTDVLSPLFIRVGQRFINPDLRPKAIAGILSVPANGSTPALQQFLQQQQARYRRASFSSQTTISIPQLRPVAATKAYLINKLPAGMVAMPVPADSVKMDFTFRQRECGFYPLDGFVDYSYSQNRNEITVGRTTVKLTPFAMDETPVTNAQFAQFLTAMNCKPVHPENFLKHWTNNAPPKGQENHPVVHVTLTDARAYAAWAGKRLPTEAEWQWVAQNGERATAWPWGNDYDSTVCNSGLTNDSTPVKQYEKGPPNGGFTT